ncbi:MAG TPA: F0F1 ATP synthase subunit epsilon [Candidatus Saccharimonadales bacterium]|jgi:F0F1-type ATP synthase epsilon subunit
MAERQNASTGEFVKISDDDSSTISDKPTMHAKVYAPFKVYFDGVAASISAINITGPFDILPHHHNFITLLDSCDLIVRQTNGNEQKVRISGGVMHVKQDQVIVFLDV